MLVTFVVVPLQVSELITIIALRPRYQGPVVFGHAGLPGERRGWLARLAGLCGGGGGKIKNPQN